MHSPLRSMPRSDPPPVRRLARHQYRLATIVLTDEFDEYDPTRLLKAIRKCMVSYKSLQAQFHSYNNDGDRLQYINRLVGMNILHCLKRKINLNYIRLLIRYLKKHDKFQSKLSIMHIGEKLIEVAIDKRSLKYGTAPVYF